MGNRLPKRRTDTAKIQARLEAARLCGATFIDGGNVLRTVTGVLHHPVVVRRAAAIAAIAQLTDEKAETG